MVLMGVVRKHYVADMTARGRSSRLDPAHDLISVLQRERELPVAHR